MQFSSAWATVRGWHGAMPSWVAWLAKGAISALCVYIICQRLDQKAGLAFLESLKVLEAKQLAAIGLVLGLALPNLAIDAFKWWLGVRQYVPQSFGQAFLATLRGISLGFLLTATVGELTAKLSLLPKRKAILAMPLTFLFSYSQFLPSFSFGLLALALWLQGQGIASAKPLYYFAVGSSLLLLLCYLAYAQLGTWLIAKADKRTIFTTALRKIRWLPIPLLALSLLRFSVYTAQYLIAYQAFAPNQLPSVILLGVWATFGIKTVIPFMSFASIFGLRELVAVSIFVPLGVPAAPVVAVSLLVWLANLALPGVVGALLPWQFDGKRVGNSKPRQ